MIGESTTVGDALSGAGVDERERAAYLQALGTLADGGLIEERSP